LPFQSGGIRGVAIGAVAPGLVVHGEPQYRPSAISFGDFVSRTHLAQFPICQINGCSRFIQPWNKGCSCSHRRSSLWRQEYYLASVTLHCFSNFHDRYHCLCQIVFSKVSRITCELLKVAYNA